MRYIDAEVFAATSAMDKYRGDAEREPGSPSHSASVAMRSPSLHATNEILAPRLPDQTDFSPLSTIIMPVATHSQHSTTAQNA